MTQRSGNTPPVRARRKRASARARSVGRPGRLVGDGALELEVTDFGPIVNAKVDLRPLTVFVGPNNTGKSYLAILVYALHRVLGGGVYYPGGSVRHRRRPLLGLNDPDLSEECIDALVEVARSLIDEADALDEATVVLPAPVAGALRSAFNEMAREIVGETSRCFGVADSHALLRKGTAKEVRISMRRCGDHPSVRTEHTLSLDRDAEFRVAVPADAPLPVDSRVRATWGRSYGRRMLYLAKERADAQSRQFMARDLLALIGEIVLPALVGPLHRPAYYLPADRTGVMHAHSVVVSSLIASAPTAGLRPSARTPMLSGVLADFLEQLIEIGQAGRVHGRIKRDLAQGIEEEILAGAVRVDRSPPVDYPSFVYRPRGWKNDLALASASSMVSELAPIVLYLRHMVGLGDVLIVEEPESHLHPAMQVALMRQLASLVKAGVRVIVTTHSEWLLEELANIVRRSEAAAVERGGRPALSSDDVGVWLFTPKGRPKGSVVSESRLDDSGLFPSGYDEVASALHNEWADLASHVESDS